MKILKYSVILVVMWCVFQVGGGVGNKLEDYLLHKYIITDSYISEINTKHYSKEWVMAVLKEFNAMAGDKEAVLFEKHVIDRRIVISDADYIDFMPPFLKDPEGPEVIGRAIESNLQCKILLKTGMDYVTFRTTLIHEYLHCMDFDHVEDDIHDLMGPVETRETRITEENIRSYAQKVAKKIWKNLKN